MMLKVNVDAHGLLMTKQAESKENISASVAIRQCSWVRLINHKLARDLIYEAVSRATEYICGKIHRTSLQLAVDLDRRRTVSGVGMRI